MKKKALLPCGNLGADIGRYVPFGMKNMVWNPRERIIDMDYKDPFFAERGVDPDVAAIRGYRMWDGDNYQEVVAQTFGHLPRAKQQWATYVARQEPDNRDLNFWGITIPRHAPKGYDPVTPGLRPSEPVKLGPPKRHLHADKAPEVFCDLLPAYVESAYCSPQRGRVKVVFFHRHGRTEEFADHISQFHGMIPDDSHSHTYYVVKVSDMRKHIQPSKSKTGPDLHMGVNSQVVHAHQKRAKYLYTPSDKFEVPWPTDHTHKDMTAQQLERHLMLHEHEGNH